MTISSSRFDHCSGAFKIWQIETKQQCPRSLKQLEKELVRDSSTSGMKRKIHGMAVVLAQLVELPTSEVRGSNPISTIIEKLFTNYDFKIERSNIRKKAHL